ncbi:MAG: 3-isopropylmalate dehydrogenase [Clostridia bacterium]|nr:3-isopropylmalate dehydrogenase [Clostridia bacterium]
MFRVVLLPGDGVGPEVVAEARAVLELVGEARVASGEAGIVCETHPVGGAAIDATGVPLPDDVWEACRRADAILLGAVGGPRWDRLQPERRPEQALFRLRRGLGLYANIRPVRTYPALATASPLRPQVLGDGVDLVIFRELTGGLYFGPRRRERAEDGQERAYDTMVYSEGEIRRIAVRAFEAARQRRGRVTSIDKANVLDTSRLWRDVVEQVASGYPDVALDHQLVDAAAMRLVFRPTDYDVILTENLFGDILSDLAAALTGSMGLLPSASLGEPGPALYEPVHGSAPDIAGQGRANPLAAILSAAMLLRFSLGDGSSADAVEAAVADAIEAGCRTADIAARGEKPLSTQEMGEAVRRFLRKRLGLGETL